MEIGHFGIEVSIQSSFVGFFNFDANFLFVFLNFDRYNDVDQATSAKIRIEQKQRDEAQNRKEKNENWEPKVCIIGFFCVLLGDCANMP